MNDILRTFTYAVKTGLIEPCQDTDSSGAANWISAEGGTVRPGSINFADLFCKNSRTDWQTSAETFCGSYNIRCDTGVHITIEFTGSSISGLYFVGDQHKVMLISKLAQTFEKFGCKRQYAAFSLDRFKENSGTVVFIDQPSDIIKIVSLCVDETVREGAKIGMETVLTGSGKRGYCATVKTVL